MRHIMGRLSGRNVLPALSVAALTLLIAACIYAPGKFTSQLDVHKDRTFSFRYTGEIVMIPLMEGTKKDDDEFTPETCYEEDTADERECTEADIAKQKEDWESARESRKKSESEVSQIMLGGVDPNNPNAGPEIADKLRRQKGWNKVEYIGNGKFDVDFAISGRLDHDFAFPTFEGTPMSNAFVQISLRQDGNMRLEAPGFGPANGTGAMAGMMSGMAKEGVSSESTLNLTDGTFTVSTNAPILANNTDEGPSAAPGGKQALVWRVNPRIPAAPTALIKLQP